VEEKEKINLVRTQPLHGPGDEERRKGKLLEEEKRRKEVRLLPPFTLNITVEVTPAPGGREKKISSERRRKRKGRVSARPGVPRSVLLLASSR